MSLPSAPERDTISFFQGYFLYKNIRIYSPKQSQSLENCICTNRDPQMMVEIDFQNWIVLQLAGYDDHSTGNR